jgi:hypothetical protein
MDEFGNEMKTYTNQDLAEYAKVYVGFARRSLRGNIEDPTKPGSSGDNQVDPVVISAEKKDHLPKLGLDSQYIGDGYPLCVDLPDKHFLMAGAKYRLLGSNPRPDLLFEKPVWTGVAPKRLTLNFASSSLASLLCNGDATNCNPNGPSFTLPKNVVCDGLECEVHEPRTVQVATGIWYEYIRPPCVKHAFFDNAQSLRRRAWTGRYMCGNPKSLDAAVICCDIKSSGNIEWRYELFGGERVPFNTAVERCSADKGLRLCADPTITTEDCNDPLQGGCDYDNIFYWLKDPCNLGIKINPEGGVAIVHQHGVASGDNNGEYLPSEWLHTYTIC